MTRIMRRDDWYIAVSVAAFCLFITLYSGGDADFAAGWLGAVLVFPMMLNKSSGR